MRKASSIAIAINRSANMLKCCLHLCGTYPDFGNLKGVHAYLSDYFSILMLESRNLGTTRSRFRQCVRSHAIGLTSPFPLVWYMLSFLSAVEIENGSRLSAVGWLHSAKRGKAPV
jgi:hypothetical protein